MAELQATMTLVEFEHWVAFAQAHPFDDHHRFHRPAALLSSINAKETNKSFKASLEFLSPDGPDPNLAGYTPAELSTYRAFGRVPPPRPAKE